MTLTIEELKALAGQISIQRRSYTIQELRVEGDSEPRITGHAAVFNSQSEDLGGFVELIAPGAFAKTIQEADVRALWNHNPDYVLGRSTAGTLVLAEDAQGLAVDITPPATQWARDLMESMRRGDVNQMSFGFRTVKDKWVSENDKTTRTLLEVKLFDVSPVTFPAYPATSVQVRAIADQLASANPDDIKALIELLQHRMAPGEPKAAGFHSQNDPIEPVAAGHHSIAMLRRRLVLADRIMN